MTDLVMEEINRVYNAVQTIRRSNFSITCFIWYFAYHSAETFPK